MNQSEIRARLAGQVFLSTMLDITDAAYVVERRRGAGCVQLGPPSSPPTGSAGSRAGFPTTPPPCARPWRGRWKSSVRG